MPEWAAGNRRELATSQPTYIVDGLSRLNPKLAMSQFPDLQAWLSSYEVADHTGLTVIYRRAIH
jgi:hypothetical protein